MTEPNQNDTPSPAMPGWVGRVAVGVLLVGIASYTLIALFGDEAKWGPRGDAVGPFAALFNAGALFAALWAVHLQRTELALQRKELQETREEMIEQRKQLERTAKAQEALADAQEVLARLQTQANEIALENIKARRFLATLTLQAEVARSRLTMATNGREFGEQQEKHKQESLHAVQSLEVMLKQLTKATND